MGAMEKKRLLCFLALSCWLLAVSPIKTNNRGLTTLLAQEIKTEPTQEELNRAKQIIHDFQEPREKEVRDIIRKFQGSNKEKAKEFFGLEEDNQNKTPHGQLFYFFSFSMPEGSIKAIVPEAEKTGAVMVIRGMKEDIGLRATLMKVAEILKHGEKESYKAEVWIHPVLFRCFHIDAVPQIVYVVGKQDEEGCSSDYIKVRGDVSLEYALSLIAKEDKNAEKYLKLIKEENFYEKH